MTTSIPAPPNSGVIDALIGWLLCDISRARKILGSHYDTGDGSCYHQGATCERFMWPCDMFLCARQAVIIHAQRNNRIPSPRPSVETTVPLPRTTRPTPVARGPR